MSSAFAQLHSQASTLLLNSPFQSQVYSPTSGVTCVYSSRNILKSHSCSYSEGARFVKLGLKCRKKGNSLSSIRKSFVICSVSNDSEGQVYDGMYGPWSVEASDRLEVGAYRAGLVTAAGSFLIASSTAFLPEDSPLKTILLGALNPLYAVGAGGLGLSLLLIHIYVTEIKRTLQLLWLVGALGSLGAAVNFAAPEGYSLVGYVLEHPGGVWAVGPLFASLTGLVFKEGLCYGKLEAAALFFLIPTLLLGHLSGVMDPSVEKGLLAIWMVLFTVFAARKFTQPVKDDLGDKSVFLFQARERERKRGRKDMYREEEENTENNRRE